MKVLKDYDLIKLNTFGVSAKAKFFVELTSEDEAVELFKTAEFKNNLKLFLGGGSNVLFTKDFDGIVVLNHLKGIEIIKEDEESVFIKSYTGEVWHDLVSFAVERNYWGIENLAFIPGSVGGAPMQNIGAYGVELKEILEELEAYDVNTGEKRIFKNSECDFGYRDSIFKHELKDKCFITSITLRLSKIPKINTSYKVLSTFLAENNINATSPKDISDAITQIRKSKLPDPKILGNAGSFFKNLYISKEKKDLLLQKYPEMPIFEEGNKYKVPSGWLSEECGWKGKKVGNVGMHSKQALVLVNHGGATGEEIKNFSESVINSVSQKFDLTLVPEVNFI